MATLAPPLQPPPAAGETSPTLKLDERSRSKAVVASQWKLMYWRFRRHRLAVVATVIVLIFYLMAIFAEFVAPMDPNRVSNTFRYVPPQPITFFDQNGHFTVRPGVYGLKGVRNPETLRFSYTVDKAQWTPIHFFVKGDPYKFWGLWTTSLHLIGTGVTQGATGEAVVPSGPAPAPSGTGAGPSAGAGSGAGASGGQTGIGSISGFGGSTGSSTSGTVSATAPAGGSGGSGAGASGGQTGIGSISGFGGNAGSVPSTGAANEAPAATSVPGGLPGSVTAPNTTGATANPAQTGVPAGATAAVGQATTINEVPFFLMGTDRLGRDVFSRIVYGARVSLSIGLVGVTLSFILGVILGGISGFYGGLVDNIVQRAIEFTRSVPTLPLIMGLAAAMPPKWPVTYVYFCITMILALFGWTGLARVVRGRFLSLREEDFILAARFTNCSEPRIIFRHMVPAFTSHLIASATLALPGMILSETALSFLGVGLRPPAISWGVLLQEAQNLQTVSLFPWLLLPCLPIVIVILSFNFMGDGLRDAADPYAR